MSKKNATAVATAPATETTPSSPSTETPIATPAQAEPTVSAVAVIAANPIVGVDSRKYVLGNVSTVKRGFLLAFCQFAQGKEVDVKMLTDEFNGKVYDGRAVDASRVKRYVSYCKAHGIFTVVGQPIQSPALAQSAALATVAAAPAAETK